MRSRLGLIALIATLAGTAFGGSASAHERARDEGKRCDYSRYDEQEKLERRERELREHRDRDHDEHGWWIGRWP